MSSERFKLRVAIFLILIKDNKVLLLKRQNTGWFDDSYDVPTGHINGREALTAAVKREAKEEVGVDIDDRDLKPVFFAHGLFTEDDEEYIYAFFEAKRWHGTPTNNEPNKCSEVAWFPLDKLPSKLTPGTKHGLAAYKAGRTYSEHGF